MRLPPAIDPRWSDFVQGRKNYALKCLASRIMYGQVRLIARSDPAQAIRLAHEYFQRNEKLAADDLKTIFAQDRND